MSPALETTFPSSTCFAVIDTATGADAAVGLFTAEMRAPPIAVRAESATPADIAKAAIVVFLVASGRRWEWRPGRSGCAAFGE